MNGFSEHLRKDAISASAFDPRVSGDPPARARAVVIGGGIIGAATAFHLAELGWTDTVVLERHSVTSGTTWHAAGLVTRTRPTHAQTELALYSRDFYKDLHERTGVDIGYYESGALSLAQSRDRMIEIDYVHSIARHHGLPVHRLGPAQIAAAFPILETIDVVGGVLFEGDATINPGLAGYATAKAAFDLGVRIVEGITVTGFRLNGGRVTGVETDRGLIECEVAVIAAGLWSRDVALLAGANVPRAGRPARVGADRGGRRRHPRPAHRPRPRRPLLRAALPRRSGHRRVRARRQIARHVVDPGRLHVRRVRARLGAHGRAAGARAPAHPGRTRTPPSCTSSTRRRASRRMRPS